MFRLYHPDVVSLIEKDRKVMPGDSVIAAEKLSHNPDKSVSNLHELRLIQAALPQSEWPDIKLTMITPAWFHSKSFCSMPQASVAFGHGAGRGGVGGDLAVQPMGGRRFLRAWLTYSAS